MANKSLAREEIKEYVRPVFNTFFKQTEELSEKSSEESSEKSSEKSSEESSEHKLLSELYEEKPFFESDDFNHFCSQFGWAVLRLEGWKKKPVLKLFLVQVETWEYSDKKGKLHLKKFAFVFERENIKAVKRYQIIRTEEIGDATDKCNCLWKLHEELELFPYVNNSWNPFTHPEKCIEFLELDDEESFTKKIADAYCDNWSEFYKKTKRLMAIDNNMDSLELKFDPDSNPNPNNRSRVLLPWTKNWVTWRYLYFYIKAFYYQDFDYRQYSVIVDCDDEALFEEPFKLNIMNEKMDEPVIKSIGNLVIDCPLILTIKPKLSGGKPKKERTKKPKSNKATNIRELEIRVDPNKYVNRRSEINGIEVEPIIVDLCDEELCEQNNYVIAERRFFSNLETLLDDLKVYSVESATKYPHPNPGSGIRHIYYGKKENIDSIIGAEVEVWIKN